MNRELLVFFEASAETILVGRLWTRVRAGRESASFAYAESWLTHPLRHALEPALTLTQGTHHARSGQPLFGAFSDSAPDRWGRLLMRREERRRASNEGRTPRTLFETDVLVMVDDHARQGALRFKEDPAGPFLANDAAFRIPPLVDLPRLLHAASDLEKDDGSDEALAVLLAPGSSLGGARPKASVMDHDETLAIAKFPAHQDEIDTVRWEAVTLALAQRAGIAVSRHRIENVNGEPVLLLTRFDRAKGGRRAFLSAMSMLGATDRESASYLDIADAIRRHGASPDDDLIALWRRVVFNILVSNTDDHLRNHAFLLEGTHGWRLSPAYDLNPVPIDIRPRVHALAIDVDDPMAGMQGALDTAPYYGVTSEIATRILRDVVLAVASWRSIAQRLDVSESEIERMKSAFEHDDFDLARTLI